MNIIQYIGECEHLMGYDIHSDRCLKRYFNVFDPVMGCDRRVAFCNDYLRLKLHHLHNGVISRFNVGDFVLSELKIPNRDWCHIFLIKVKIYVIERPKTWIYVELRDAMGWYAKNQSKELYQCIHQAIDNYCDQKKQYKKYARTCEEITRLSRKIRHLYGTPEEMAIPINELLLYLLKTFYNETS